MTAPVQPKDSELIRTWPNQWTQDNHPPTHPELVEEFRDAAKKTDRKSVEMLKKDP